MVKHLQLRRIRRRSSSPRLGHGTAESSEPFSRPVSPSGSRRHPFNRARRVCERGSNIISQPPPPPIDIESSATRIADILNSVTEPPSPVCAMDTEERIHICPLPECDCRKSLTPVKRSSAQIPKRAADLRIILLVTSINSFAQLVYARLKERASKDGDVAIKIFYPGTKCTNGTSDLIVELVEFETDIILCPFLTAKIPSELYQKFLTLVVHPGPPGDVGPSALDWTLLGDDGIETDATSAMAALRKNPKAVEPRAHWGCIVFQADEEMDKGPVWAWEQYLLPQETITKGYLYHFGHSPAAWKALDSALNRVVGTAIEAKFYVQKVIIHDDVPTKEELEELCDEDLDLISERVCNSSRLAIEPATQASARWADQIAPLSDWATHPVSREPDSDVIHSCGTLAHRPLIRPADRIVNWDEWTAEKIVQFVSAFDSQPGAAFHPKTASSKKLFIYGAHCQHNAAPGNTWQHVYEEWKDIPNGAAVAVRSGAVLFKTEPENSQAVGVWITHGRVLKPVGAPIEAKIGLEQALNDSGHGKMLAKAVEWPLNWSRYSPGDWQEAYVHTQPHPLGVVQFVYWSFYNGAFTTEKCELLLRVLEWAGTSMGEKRVVALVLMGGHYFSNGIALNAIEHRGNAAPNVEDADQWAGEETWANINAIDNIVEYLAGDTDPHRSERFQGLKTLCERGVTTIAVIRGNAAAGGVALAAACDIVMASEDTVLNPAYRAMGLHGSEFHSWSYRTRCGDEMAATLLREMLPMTATAASKIGLVDLVYSRRPGMSFPPFHGPDLYAERAVTLSIRPDVNVRCAPWCQERADNVELPTTILDTCRNKVNYFGMNRAEFYLPPLINYRTEELSQMLLDCHHPTRSQRYHTRRRAFIRKTKCGKTPSRYAPAIEGLVVDEEHFAAFDATGPWDRGAEWQHYAEEPIPPTLRYSAWTRVVLFPDNEYIVGMRPGYTHEGQLNSFDRMLQRIAMAYTSDLTIDIQALIDQIVWIDGHHSWDTLVMPDIPLSNKSYIFRKWVLPQLGPLRQKLSAANQQPKQASAAITQIEETSYKEPDASYSTSGAESPLPPNPNTTNGQAAAAFLQAHGISNEPLTLSYISDGDESSLPPFGITGEGRIFDFPSAVSSSSIVGMSTAPSADTAIATPPRLPFSRSASPIPEDQTNLGSIMLHAMINSVNVQPPKPESRRYSRLNTGVPDLLRRVEDARRRFG